MATANVRYGSMAVAVELGLAETKQGDPLNFARMTVGAGLIPAASGLARRGGLG